MIQTSVNLTPTVVKIMETATPISKFVGAALLPEPARVWLVSQFGTAEKADAALQAGGKTNAQVLAAWLLTLPADQVQRQTDALAKGLPLWLACVQTITTAIVDGEQSALVSGIAAGHAARARADGWGAMAKAAGLIEAGNKTSAAGLATAKAQVDARFADQKAKSDALFDAWRPKVPADYQSKANDLVYTNESTPLDPRFLQPLRIPDPLAEGAYQAGFPSPYAAGFTTAKNTKPFIPVVSYMGMSQQLAPKQRVLGSQYLTTAAASEWNTTVRPAVQALLDLAWLRQAVATQLNEAQQRATLYAERRAEYLKQEASAAALATQIEANNAAALAKLPPFAQAVIVAAGKKLGLAKSAEVRVESALAIQKLALQQAAYTNYLARLQQALAGVKVEGTNLFVDLAADLVEIGKANQAAAIGASDAGKVQSEQAGKAKDDIAAVTAPPTTVIDAAAGGTEAGKSATQLADQTANEANNKDANGTAITTTSDDSADQIVDPDPYGKEAKEEPQGGLGALGWGAIALVAYKLLMR